MLYLAIGFLAGSVTGWLMAKEKARRAGGDSTAGVGATTGRPDQSVPRMFAQILEELGRLRCALGGIGQQVTFQTGAIGHLGGIMAGELDALRAEVAKNTEVDESAKVLLARLAAKIQELINAGADPAALQALVDSLKADNQALADAVVANTPAA